MCRGHFGGEDFRDSKVPYLEDFSLAVEHDVLSLQVAVQDVEGVHVLNGHHQLRKELQNVLEEEGRERRRGGGGGGRTRDGERGRGRRGGK